MEIVEKVESSSESNWLVWLALGDGKLLQVMLF